MAGARQNLDNVVIREIFTNYEIGKMGLIGARGKMMILIYIPLLLIW